MIDKSFDRRPTGQRQIGKFIRHFLLLNIAQDGNKHTGCLETTEYASVKGCALKMQIIIGQNIKIHTAPLTRHEICSKNAQKNTSHV